jgi:hypothetical protein
MRKNPSTRHPRWCDPRQCVTGEHGARHTSRATRLATGEQTFELTLIQHDPDGAPDLLIEVIDTADPDGLHVLAVHEIKALAETLLIEYLKPCPSPPRPDHVQRDRTVINRDRRLLACS